MSPRGAGTGVRHEEVEGHQMALGNLQRGSCGNGTGTVGGKLMLKSAHYFAALETKRR